MLTRDQKERRSKGLGGSDIAGILGISPFKNCNPLDIYLSKVLPIFDEEEEVNPGQWWGNELEEKIIKRYLYENPGQTMTFPDTVFDKEHPVLFAHVDGLLSDGAIFEAKNVDRRFSGDEWGLPGSDHIPNSYYLQVLHYARILDAPYVIVGAYMGGGDCRFYQVNRNKVIEDKIRDKALDFWEKHVLAKNPPPAQNFKQQSRLWKKSISESKLHASSEIELYINKLKSLKAARKEIEDDEDKTKMIICDYMKDTEALVDNEDRVLVTWKSHKKTRFDTYAFKKVQSDLYQKYQVSSTVRTLRIKDYD
jgi:putative phage-type endonuclease